MYQSHRRLLHTQKYIGNIYFCAKHKCSLYAFGHTKGINSITQLLVLISDMSDFDSVNLANVIKIRKSYFPFHL